MGSDLINQDEEGSTYRQMLQDRCELAFLSVLL